MAVEKLAQPSFEAELPWLTACANLSCLDKRSQHNPPTIEIEELCRPCRAPEMQTTVCSSTPADLSPAADPRHMLADDAMALAGPAPARQIHHSWFA